MTREDVRIRRALASAAGRCSNCTTRPVLAGRRSCKVCTLASRSRIAARTSLVLTVSARTHERIAWIADTYDLTYSAAVDLALACAESTPGASAPPRARNAAERRTEQARGRQ
jgi:hypothetical protein